VSRPGSRRASNGQPKATLRLSVTGNSVYVLTALNARGAMDSAVVTVRADHTELPPELLLAAIPKIGPQPSDVCATALRDARL